MQNCRINGAPGRFQTRREHAADVAVEADIERADLIAKGLTGSKLEHARRIREIECIEPRIDTVSGVNGAPVTVANPGTANDIRILCATCNGITCPNMLQWNIDTPDNRLALEAEWNAANGGTAP